MFTFAIGIWIMFAASMSGSWKLALVGLLTSLLGLLLMVPVKRKR